MIAVNNFTILGKNLNKKKIRRNFPRRETMDIGQMKNIVVLKNLPSNIVDEAIVVLKANKKVKKIQYTKTKEQQGNVQRQDGYIVKEAEMLINNYVKNMETERKTKRNVEWEKKYNRQKYISFALAFVALVEFIII